MAGQSAQIEALNQILAIIDKNSAEWQAGRVTMKPAEKEAKLLMLQRMVADAQELAGKILPKPVAVLEDLRKLARQLR